MPLRKSSRDGDSFVSIPLWCLDLSAGRTCGLPCKKGGAKLQGNDVNGEEDVLVKNKLCDF